MLSRYFKPAAAAALLLLPSLAQAQVEQFIDCNPMDEDSCDPIKAFGTEHNFNFNQSADPDLWEVLAGRPEYNSETGARFAITQQGESTTLMSKFYIFWGRTEMWIKTAPGTGIVSSVMLLSDTLDEVDWEVLGSNTTHASTNFFSKGVQDYRNAGYHPMSGMHDDYHNYTIVWTEEKMDWYIDGATVRTLVAVEANNTDAYPQTPMRISLGIWAGGDPTLPEGTRIWAGGDTNYDEGPFYMYVKSVQVEDYSEAKEYSFRDRSGSMDSVELIEGEPEAVEIINRPPPEPEQSLGDRFNALPEGARIGIYAGAGVVGAAIIFAAIFYCIRQRRRGAREAKAATQRAEAERLEMDQFRAKGIDPDSFASHASEYKSPASGVLTGTNAYSAVPNGPESPTSPINEKAFGVAAVGAAAGAAVGAAAIRPGSQSPRTPTSAHGLNPNPFSSYEDAYAPPRSAHSNHSGNPFASYEDQPRVPQQDYNAPSAAAYGRQGSPGPGRMNSPGPNRMNSPGPNRMASPGPSRMGSPGPGRMGSPGPGHMASPGPGRMGSPGPNRMQSPGPGAGGPPRNFSNSPGPRPPRGDDYWNQEGGYR